MYQIKNKYITSNLTVSKSIEIANNKKIKKTPPPPADGGPRVLARRPFEVVCEEGPM